MADDIDRQKLEAIQADLKNSGMTRRALLDRLKEAGIGFGAAAAFGFGASEAEAAPQATVTSEDPALKPIVEEAAARDASGIAPDMKAYFRIYPRFYPRYHRYFRYARYFRYGRYRRFL